MTPIVDPFELDWRAFNWCSRGKLSFGLGIGIIILCLLHLSLGINVAQGAGRTPDKLASPGFRSLRPADAAAPLERMLPVYSEWQGWLMSCPIMEASLCETESTGHLFAAGVD